MTLIYEKQPTRRGIIAHQIYRFSVEAVQGSVARLADIRAMKTLCYAFYTRLPKIQLRQPRSAQVESKARRLVSACASS